MLDSWQVIGISVGLDPQSPKRNADLIDGMRTWKTSFEQPWMSPPKSTHVFSKRDHFQKDFEKYPTHPAATPPSIWALVSHPGGWAKKDLGATPNFIQPWSSGHFGSGVFVKTRSLRELIYNPDGYFHHVYSQVAGAYPPSSHGHFLSLWQVDRQYLSVEAPCARTKKGAGAQGTREGWRVGVVPVGVVVKNMGQLIFFTGVGFRVYGIFLIEF